MAQNLYKLSGINMMFLTTLRQARLLCGGLLLGVLLALLPLRAWAAATMHLSAPLSAPLSQAAADETPLPPCHAAVVDSDGAAPDDGNSGCSLCSLCQSCALCWAECSVAHDPAPTAAPAAAPQGHGPPALPLPERPPRA